MPLEKFLRARPRRSRASNLARALLVLHGTADVNVPFLESVWLMDEAVKENKSGAGAVHDFPAEFHYFTREHVLRDAWNRVDHFSATQLRATSGSH
jgi:dipeptidyl aminopeptidase/acylaminoacyl peptidase